MIIIFNQVDTSTGYLQAIKHIKTPSSCCVLIWIKPITLNPELAAILSYLISPTHNLTLTEFLLVLWLHCSNSGRNLFALTDYFLLKYIHLLFIYCRVHFLKTTCQKWGNVLEWSWAKHKIHEFIERRIQSNEMAVSKAHKVGITTG